jgi:hypothetical protein
VPSIPSGFDLEHSDLVPTQAQAFPDFPLYSVGDAFEGNSLVGITRRLDPPTSEYPLSLRANFVNFIYGRCSAGDDAGCMPPLEVQIWPACERNLSSYSMTPVGDPPPHENLSLRGVPAALFEDPRLEVYTGNVTIVLFGHERQELLRTADALRGVNNDVGTGVELPAPAPGALEGKLQCVS